MTGHPTTVKCYKCKELTLVDYLTLQDFGKQIPEYAHIDCNAPRWSTGEPINIDADGMIETAAEKVAATMLFLILGVIFGLLAIGGGK